MNTLAIQTRLSALGFDPGPLDGAWGRLSIAAAKAFQTSVGLAPDGVVGSRTREALAGGTQDAQRPKFDPIWLVEANRWMGMREIAGPSSNSRIVAWGRAAERWYRDDNTPWCGAFVFAQFAAALPDEPLPTHPLYARNWARFGVALDLPAVGAVLVFSRGPNAGHVGFYVGEDANRFRVLGGNQSNAVSEAWIAKSRLISIRWPAGVARPASGRVALSGGGATSVDEA